MTRTRFCVHLVHYTKPCSARSVSVPTLHTNVALQDYRNIWDKSYFWHSHTKPRSSTGCPRSLSRDIEPATGFASQSEEEENIPG